MLLRQHAGGQGIGTVTGQHGHNHLPPYRPVVQFGRDLVNRGAGKTTTGIHGALVRVQAREGREQRGVDIEQAALVERHKVGRHNAHKARQQNQRGYGAAHIPLRDLPRQRAVKIFALGICTVINGSGRQAGLTRQFQPAGVGAVADHTGNPRTEVGGPVFPLRGGHDGSHVGATAGNQQNDIAHAGDYPRRLCLFRLADPQ